MAAVEKLEPEPGDKGQDRTEFSDTLTPEQEEKQRQRLEFARQTAKNLAPHYRINPDDISSDLWVYAFYLFWEKAKEARTQTLGDAIYINPLAIKGVHNYLPPITKFNKSEFWQAYFKLEKQFGPASQFVIEPEADKNGRQAAMIEGKRRHGQDTKVVLIEKTPAAQLRAIEAATKGLSHAPAPAPAAPASAPVPAPVPPPPAATTAATSTAVDKATETNLPATSPAPARTERFQNAVNTAKARMRALGQKLEPAVTQTLTKVFKTEAGTPAFDRALSIMTDGYTGLAVGASFAVANILTGGALIGAAAATSAILTGAKHLNRIRQDQDFQSDLAARNLKSAFLRAAKPGLTGMAISAGMAAATAIGFNASAFDFVKDLVSGDTAEKAKELARRAAESDAARKVLEQQRDLEERARVMAILAKQEAEDLAASQDELRRIADSARTRVEEARVAARRAAWAAREDAESTRIAREALERETLPKVEPRSFDSVLTSDAGPSGEEAPTADITVAGDAQGANTNGLTGEDIAKKYLAEQDGLRQAGEEAARRFFGGADDVVVAGAAGAVPQP